MKKSLAICLALILALTLLSACSIKNNIVPDEENTAIPGGDDTQTGSPVTDGGDDDLDDALSELEEYLKSLGVEEDEYGFTQYGVWNYDLLPDVLPKEPSAGIVEIDRTEYKGNRHEDLMVNLGGSYSVGNIEFPDKNYERHMVLFTCTKDAILEFVAAMKSSGFTFGEMSEEYGQVIFEWLGNGYYVCLDAKGDWEDDGGEFWTSIEATPNLGNPHPASFSGIPLPDFGLVINYNEFSGYGSYGSEDDWEDIYDFWDVYNDRGDLPDNWSISYEYYLVYLSEAKAYVQKLASLGWAIEYENEGYDEWSEYDTYYSQLTKGDLFAAVEAYEGSGSNHMTVAFATMAELLSY